MLKSLNLLSGGSDMDLKNVCFLIIDMQHDFLDEKSPLFVSE
jgi:hypothetical protein